MSNQPYPRKPKNVDRYGQERQISSMATPRRPEPPKKGGFLGVVFTLGIFGGLVWLVMLIFNIGPYATVTPVQTRTPQDQPFLVTETLAASENLFTTATTAGLTVTNPTATLIPSVSPTSTQTPTQEVLPYVLDGEPEPVPSSMIRPQLGCEWLVIAGQVWDLQGDPMIGLKLHLYGELNGLAIDQYALTGAEEAAAYGKSGYEFALEGLLVDSEATLFIQLVDADDVPLSLPYAVHTYEDCSRNLILVNFKQVR